MRHLLFTLVAALASTASAQTTDQRRQAVIDQEIRISADRICEVYSSPVGAEFRRSLTDVENEIGDLALKIAPLIGSNEALVVFDVGTILMTGAQETNAFACRLAVGAALEQSIAQSSQAAGADPSIVGHWVGYFDWEGIVPTEFDFSQGVESGTWFYPTAPCRGTFVPRDIETQRLTFTMSVDSGDCIDGGTIVFEFKDENELTWTWRQASFVVTGELWRRAD